MLTTFSSLSLLIFVAVFLVPRINLQKIVLWPRFLNRVLSSMVLEHGVAVPLEWKGGAFTDVKEVIISRLCPQFIGCHCSKILEYFFSNYLLYEKLSVSSCNRVILCIQDNVLVKPSMSFFFRNHKRTKLHFQEKGTVP